MSKTAKIQKACGACGLTDRLVELDDSDHRTLAYCCAGRNLYVAKPSCLRKILEEHKPVCVVCGTDDMYFSGARLRPVCKTCDATINQLKPEAELSWYVFRPYDAFGRHTGRSHADYTALGNGLRRALCGDDRSVFIPGAEDISPGKRNGLDSFSTGDIWARLTKTQAEGLKEFFEAFGNFAEVLSTHAHEQGGALLVKLARGEVSIDDFNDGRESKR